MFADINARVLFHESLKLYDILEFSMGIPSFVHKVRNSWRDLKLPISNRSLSQNGFHIYGDYELFYQNFQNVYFILFEEGEITWTYRYIFDIFLFKFQACFIFIVDER